MPYKERQVASRSTSTPIHALSQRVRIPGKNHRIGWGRPSVQRRGGALFLATAVVILGGLVTSTVLHLLVLPTLAQRYGRMPTKPRDRGSGN